MMIIKELNIFSRRQRPPDARAESRTSS
jgi:hypothetical protein